MYKFCPNCTNEIKPCWKCCPYCGFKFDNVESALDDALDKLRSFAKEKQEKENKLRILIIRELYDDAKKFCKELIDMDPMDKVGYIGLIRIQSKNYKEYDGIEIAKNIKIAEEIFGEDDLLSDTEYAAYAVARNQYFEEKELRRIEAEKAEQERKARVAREAEEAKKNKRI